VLTLTPDELLTTTRSVRRRLDLSRPVPRAVVEECNTWHAERFLLDQWTLEPAHPLGNGAKKS